MCFRQLPGADAQNGAGGNPKGILGMNHGDIGHPGVAVFKVDDSPGEGARDHYIEAASSNDAGSVIGNLYRPVTSRGIVSEGAVAVVP